MTVNWTDPADNGSPIINYAVVPSPSCVRVALSAG